MHVLPHTRQEWAGFLLVPFKAYVLIAFPFAMMFGRGLRVDVTILWILMGYIVSFFVLGTAGVVQAVGGLRLQSLWSLGFAVLAALLGWRLLPYLAS